MMPIWPAFRYGWNNGRQYGRSNAAYRNTGAVVPRDDEQVLQLPARFAKANTEWLEDEWGKSRGEAQQEWMNGFADGFRRFTGRLNETQLAYLSDAVTRYEPEAPTWLAYRERWQDALLDLLAKRANAEQFSETLNSSPAIGTTTMVTMLR